MASVKVTIQFFYKILFLVSTYPISNLLYPTDVQRCPSRPDSAHLLTPDGVTTDHSFEDEPAVEFKSYKRRFYILLLFALIGFTQYCAWNTYGPIATTAKMVFGWSNTHIAILASMDPITYLCTMQFFSWMMDEKGIWVLLCCP